MERRLIFIPILLALWASCASTGERKVNLLTPAPPEPAWAQVEPDPIVDVDPATGYYTVKPSFVHWATQARDWVKRMRDWKQRNEIP